MALITITSPHTTQNNSIQKVMLMVITASLPGLAALTYGFGWGTFFNVLLAVAVALATEAAILHLRGRPLKTYLMDGSAVVTGLLLGLSIPPLAPWWMTLLGTAFAIGIVKQLYGGLGNNPFNPAMAGYVLLLISFPVEMTSWLPPLSQLSQQMAEHAAASPGVMTALQAIFTNSIQGEAIDAFTMATPLDSLKTASRELGLLAPTELTQVSQQYAVIGHHESIGLYSKGWLLANIAFLAGGLLLIQQRIISWHIPLSMLAALALMAGLFNLLGYSNGSVLFHLFSGGTMLGAFFIATDPVSAATSKQGRIIFGALIGVLVYIIRTWGGYPDAIAFSVLLLNLAAPTIDYYTQPRTYGHNQAKRGSVKSGG